MKVAIALSIAATIALSGPVQAHSWYPQECCNEHGLRPRQSIARFVPTGGGTPQLIVTSRHGTAIVPEDYPVQESKDGRMHVCMRHSPTDPFTDIGQSSASSYHPGCSSAVVPNRVLKEPLQHSLAGCGRAALLMSTLLIYGSTLFTECVKCNKVGATARG